MDKAVPSGVLRLMIVDDHKSARQALGLRLGREPDLLIVGEAATLHDAVEEVARLTPDVVISDISLPDGDGIELLQHLREMLPAMRGVVLTLDDTSHQRRRAQQCAAAPLVGKHESIQHLLDAIRGAKNIM